MILKKDIEINVCDNKVSNLQLDISFCLPVYNTSQYLLDCIRSISEQNFMGITYEILCIDDCSTDDSYNMLLNLSEIYSKIRILKNESNLGVSFTRNKMIKLSRGKYIWFVDPDDLLYKNIVNYFFLEIEKRGCDILLGNYIRVSENFHNQETTNNNKNISGGGWINDLSAYLPVDNNGIRMNAVWAGLFKKNFLIKNNLFFNEKMIAQEDTLFYYEMQLRTSKIYKCECPCYLYRQRASSIMNTHSKTRSYKYFLSMVELLSVYETHLNEGDYNNELLLQEKILHMKQNLAWCLASIDDTLYVREQLKKLKVECNYPYKFRKSTLHTQQPLLRKLLYFSLPLEPIFWIVHYAYKVSYR